MEWRIDLIVSVNVDCGLWWWWWFFLLMSTFSFIVPEPMMMMIMHLMLLGFDYSMNASKWSIIWRSHIYLYKLCLVDGRTTSAKPFLYDVLIVRHWRSQVISKSAAQMTFIYSEVGISKLNIIVQWVLVISHFLLIYLPHALQQTKNKI